MPNCAIKGCKRSSRILKNRKISYFSFPKTEICKEWVKFSENPNVNTITGKVCSLHFSPSAFREKTWIQQQLPDSRSPRLKHDAVPTKNLPPYEWDEFEIVKIAEIDEHGDLQILLKDFDAKSVMKLLNALKSMPTQEIQHENQLPNDNVENQSLAHHPSISNNVKSNAHNSILEKVEETISSEFADFLVADQLLVNELEMANKAIGSLIKNNEGLMRQIAKMYKILSVKERKILRSEKKIGRYEKILTKLFTPAQIKILSSKNQKATKWSPHDISTALSLQKISPGAYDFVRTDMKIPLPSISTLRDWNENLDENQGILDGLVVSGIMKSQQC